jgi:hypothetical protein
MTRPLRKAHCHFWVVLSMVLVMMLWAALVSRRTSTPLNESLVEGRQR